jgi:hypothetical protein
MWVAWPEQRSVQMLWSLARQQQGACRSESERHLLSRRCGLGIAALWCATGAGEGLDRACPGYDRDPSEGCPEPWSFRAPSYTETAAEMQPSYTSDGALGPHELPQRTLVVVGRTSRVELRLLAPTGRNDDLAVHS